MGSPPAHVPCLVCLHVCFVLDLEHQISAFGPASQPTGAQGRNRALPFYKSVSWGCNSQSCQAGIFSPAHRDRLLERPRRASENLASVAGAERLKPAPCRSLLEQIRMQTSTSCLVRCDLAGSPPQRSLTTDTTSRGLARLLLKWVGTCVATDFNAAWKMIRLLERWVGFSPVSPTNLCTGRSPLAQPLRVLLLHSSRQYKDTTLAQLGPK